MNYCLPEVKNEPLIPEHFPTAMQAFIFRNWEMVDINRLAKVLETSTENVETEAMRMGLMPQVNTKVWAEKGYITIIRANWHLIPYEQLAQLLGWDNERLALVLKEEDFLDIKLGQFKPDCKKVVYSQLTEAEIKATEKIKEAMQKLNEAIPKNAKEPFDFRISKKEVNAKKEAGEGQIEIDNTWSVVNKTGSETVGDMAERFISSVKASWNIELSLQSGTLPRIELSYIKNKKDEYHEISVEKDLITIKAGASAGILRGLYRLEELAKFNGGMQFDIGVIKREPRFGERYIYSFCGLYEKALDVDSSIYCPDSLLEEYARVGVNGIWIQGVLYRILEFPFAPEMSEGWQLRLENLRKFVERAKKYGIKIFLYINEPRNMPLSFYEKYPEMKGSVDGQYACMCVSAQKTEEYLYNAIKKVCKEVPQLGGFFTITMSENHTHCKSRAAYMVSCERCKDVAVWELVAKVNSIIAKAAHSVNPSIKVIAWDWAWSEGMGFMKEDIKPCLEEIPEDVIIMCKRESEVPFIRGGVKGKVGDYSISVPGLSEQSVRTWGIAKETGHEIAAKVQVNCSWECSTTPYIPVYRTLYRHLESLLSANVDHIMLSWTLGGYPSPSIRMMAEEFFIENGKAELDFDRAIEIVYGDEAEKIKQATDIFCEAFGEFPFHIHVLYNGPQNAGAANLLYHKPTGYHATMTCYAYDDIESWRGIYTPEILEQQFKKTSEKWGEGMELLEEGNLKDISYVSYSLFRASYNQVKFIRLRDAYIKEKTEEVRKELSETIAEEKLIAEKIFGIMCLHPEVGFEAANHYYFNKTSIMEKIVNCNWLMEYYR